ncbi:hypothetical protein BS50DRAFT_543869 [Corynespora cassiicola Philippines]|uniref:Zn(2)-C6 fungal-type domain-containing protein n=1 Tax=Corynespora cassiicola Philippines TaxID=1448308 RepID=A0A2T2P221_CORCC|nr:hypothetical protein BS50DRAFT_543869 [Corynespora cassiicola Philippines]
MSAATKLARRKRAVIACQFCRLRKSRCDGIKPVCGFCRHHGATCIWDNGSETGQESTPGERHILKRLDAIEALLSTKAQITQGISASPGELHDALPFQDTIHANSPSTCSIPKSDQPIMSNNTPMHDTTRCESLLRWPIFAGKIDPRDAAIDSFPLHHGQNTSLGINHIGAAGIPDHLYVPLCRKFLAHVHPRNPLLQGSQLVEHAKVLTENGLGWDGNTCLVLIACAIACYTSPWDPDRASRSSEVEYSQKEDALLAEAYYMAAKKRIGLLDYTLVDIQCLFFASVYERYAFNPVQAWFYLQQASIKFQAYVKQSSSGTLSKDVSTQDQYLEQRLFWSIYKTELELLPELPFKPSGIEELSRPESIFPAPPNITFASDVNISGSSEEDEIWQEERSWFFYLAEVSLQRTISDTLWLLYRKGEQYWVSHTQFLASQYEESERQMRLWYSHLPASIRFDPLERPDNELSFNLQGRFRHWQSCVLRPLFYCAIHRPIGEPLTPQIHSATQEYVLLCATSITHINQHQRHGMIWAICRSSFTCALVILAVVIRSDVEIVPPPNWEAVITTAIIILKRWEPNAGDIKAMRSILENIFHTIMDENGVPSVN